MARIVIEHSDFTLTFHCPKLAKVLQKANHNGLTVAGGQLYSHYSWTGDVLSVKLEKESGDEKVDPSEISSGGHAQVERGAPFFFDNTVYRVRLKMNTSTGCEKPWLDSRFSELEELLLPF